MAFSIQQLYRSSVSLVCVAFIVVLTPSLTALFYLKQRAAAEQMLLAQAHMVALDLGRNFKFESVDADYFLPLLESNRDYVIACVYDMSGEVKAAHLDSLNRTNADEELNCNALYRHPTYLNYVVARARIIGDKLAKPMGDVILAGIGPRPFANLPICFGFSLLLGGILGLFCWGLGMRLKYSFIKPIRHIASTAQRVSLYKDYSLRVVPGPLDVIPYEVQSLTDSFNAMLKEIEDRDSRLSRKSVELEQSRRVAEAANHSKSLFLANVSHELRTPLNAIIGFSTILSEQQFGPLANPKYVEYARDIHDSGKHLLDVINDILDLSRAETGKLSVTFSSNSISKIIDKALNIVAAQAHDRKVDIYTDIPEKLPKIIADPVRLTQILLNVLSNAIKFSNEGGQVMVRVRAESARQGVYYFVLTIEDKGIGMTDAEIRKVFSAFNQAEAGLSRKYDGAGLGLPLTKRLVDLHHGKIKIESVKGEGTTVTIRLTSDPALLD